MSQITIPTESRSVITYELEKEVTQLRQQNDEYEKQLKVLEKNVEGQQYFLNQYIDKLSESEKEKSTLKTENEKLKEERSDLVSKTTLDFWKQQNESLSIELQKRDQAIETLNQLKDRCSANLLLARESRHIEVKKRNKIIEDLGMKLAESEDQFGREKRDKAIKLLKERDERQKNEIASLTEQLNAAKKEKNRSQHIINAKQQWIDDYKQENEELRIKLDSSSPSFQSSDEARRPIRVITIKLE